MVHDSHGAPGQSAPLSKNYLLKIEENFPSDRDLTTSFGENTLPFIQIIISHWATYGIVK